MPYYKNLGYNQGDFPHAEAYYNGCISLPNSDIFFSAAIRRISSSSLAAFSSSAETTELARIMSS